MTKKTNIWTKDQLPPVGVEIDAQEDYYKISDAKTDHNYMHSQIMDMIHKQSRYTNNCSIIYGGEITDGGGGTIDISEGYCFSKDTEGNRVPVFIPSQIGVSLPAGWNDNRQLWVLAKGDVKTTGVQRAHYNTLNYYFQVEDTFIGEADNDDFFVDADPNIVADTITCLGSFQMNVAVFTKIIGERTNLFSINKNNVTIDSQEMFEEIFIKTAVNAYKIKDNIESIYLKKGAYNLATIMSGGDIAPVISMNDCVRFICEKDDLLTNGINWGALDGYLQTSNDGTKIENLNIYGDGSVRTSDRTFFIDHNNCVLEGCLVYNRLGTVKGFYQTLAKIGNGYYGCIVDTIGAESFYQCKGLHHCETRNGCTVSFELCEQISVCKSSGGGIGFNNCKNISGSYAYDPTAEGFKLCNQVTGSKAWGCTYGFLTCYRVSGCFAENNSIRGFDSCWEVSACYATTSGIGFYQCGTMSACRSDSNTDGFYECNIMSSCRANSNTRYGYYGCKYTSAGCYGTGNGTNNWYSVTYGAIVETTCVGCDEDGHPLFQMYLAATILNTVLFIAVNHGLANAYTNHRIHSVTTYSDPAGTSFYEFKNYIIPQWNGYWNINNTQFLWVREATAGNLTVRAKIIYK